MKKWIKAKNIGQLYYEKILVRFDIPLLFTILDEYNNRYIVVCSDEERGIYVVGKTDTTSLLRMLMNETTMYDYFRQRDSMFIVSFDIETNEYTWKSSSQDSIDDDMLPDKGAYLGLRNKKISDYIEELQDIEFGDAWSNILLSSSTEIDIIIANQYLVQAKNWSNLYKSYTKTLKEDLSIQIRKDKITKYVIEQNSDTISSCDSDSPRILVAA